MTKVFGKREFFQTIDFFLFKFIKCIVKGYIEQKSQGPPLAIFALFLSVLKNQDANWSQLLLKLLILVKCLPSPLVLLTLTDVEVGPKEPTFLNEMAYIGSP